MLRRPSAFQRRVGRLTGDAKHIGALLRLVEVVRTHNSRT